MVAKSCASSQLLGFFCTLNVLRQKRKKRILHICPSTLHAPVEFTTVSSTSELINPGAPPHYTAALRCWPTRPTGDPCSPGKQWMCVYVYIYIRKIYLSIHPSIYPSIHPSIYLSCVCLYVYIVCIYSVYMSIMCI